MEHFPNSFNDLVLESRRPLAMPLAVYPGLALTGAKVHDIVTNPQAQCEAQLALHERYHTPFVLSAMDLSAEAEAFGCTIQASVAEIPSVIGRLVTNFAQAEKLAVPQPGDRRTAVFLETVRRLRRLPDRPLVLGGCIGPFSLATRLVGEVIEIARGCPGTAWGFGLGAGHVLNLVHLFGERAQAEAFGLDGHFVAAARAMRWARYWRGTRPMVVGPR